MGFIEHQYAVKFDKVRNFVVIDFVLNDLERSGHKDRR